MGSDDKKMEIILQGNEVEVLLKALAEALRNPVLPEAMAAYAPHLHSCGKFEIALKRLGGMAELKLKVKGLPATGEQLEAGVPGTYKSIKKRLKTSFKYLKHSLDNLLLPPAEVLDAFLLDSLAMCEHPERGPHDYGDHLRLCNALKDAFDRQDREAMNTLVRELELAKKACHAAK